jgi:hypothetical protein
MKTTTNRKSSKDKKPSFLLSLTENPQYIYYQGACIALFVLFAGFLTAVYNHDFLKWAEELSLFLPTRLFLADNLKTAGGLLSYAGTFLTQFFYYPYLGSFLLILLLLLIQYLTIKAFEIPKQYYPLSFIPSVLLLLSVTELGYVLFSLKSPGYLFSNSLGILVVLAALWGYRKIKNNRIQTGALFLFLVSTYPLFGFYTLFTALLAVITGLTQPLNPLKGTWRMHTLKALGICFLIVLVPYLYWAYIYNQMPESLIYIAGLPKFYFTRTELRLWLPFILLFLSLFIFLIFLRKKQKAVRVRHGLPLLSFGIFVCFLCFLYSHSFKDNNFRTELKMNKAIEANDWEKVVTLGGMVETGRAPSPHKPTRLIIMNYNLALYKLGKAGDLLFSMDNNSVLQTTPRPALVLMHTGAQQLYFQYGKTNYSYRWCMENNVEYGVTIDRLKYMVKCSLMNGEFALAQKYVNTLKKTLFYKDWANKYQSYIDDRRLIAEDAEMKAIAPLTAYESLPDGDGNLLEAYLLNSFAYMKGGPPEMVELSLQCNLILKNIERFWSRFFLYARTHDRIPVHYQEAALLYSYLEGKVDISKFDLDKGIVDRFNLLIALSQKYEHNSDEKNKALFKPQFGNTFWYYYFFIKDIKTN